MFWFLGGGLTLFGGAAYAYKKYKNVKLLYNEANKNYKIKNYIESLKLCNEAIKEYRTIIGKFLVDFLKGEKNIINDVSHLRNKCIKKIRNEQLKIIKYLVINYNFVKSLYNYANKIENYKETLKLCNKFIKDFHKVNFLKNIINDFYSLKNKCIKKIRNKNYENYENVKLLFNKANENYKIKNYKEALKLSNKSIEKYQTIDEKFLANFLKNDNYVFKRFFVKYFFKDYYDNDNKYIIKKNILLKRIHSLKNKSFNKNYKNYENVKFLFNKANKKYANKKYKKALKLCNKSIEKYRTILIESLDDFVKSDNNIIYSINYLKKMTIKKMNEVKINLNKEK